MSGHCASHLIKLIIKGVPKKVGGHDDAPQGVDHGEAGEEDEEEPGGGFSLIGSVGDLSRILEIFRHSSPTISFLSSALQRSSHMSLMNFLQLSSTTLLVGLDIPTSLHLHILSISSQKFSSASSVLSLCSRDFLEHGSCWRGFRTVTSPQRCPDHDSGPPAPAGG